MQATVIGLAGVQRKTNASPMIAPTSSPKANQELRKPFAAHQGFERKCRQKVGFADTSRDLFVAPELYGTCENETPTADDGRRGDAGTSRTIATHHEVGSEVGQIEIFRTMLSMGASRLL